MFEQKYFVAGNAPFTSYYALITNGTVIKMLHFRQNSKVLQKLGKQSFWQNEPSVVLKLKGVVQCLFCLPI